MSEQDEELTLAHDVYLINNGIDVDQLPDELDAENEAINGMIDQYSENPTDALFDKIEATSKALEVKIKAWHEAEKVKAEEAKKAQSQPTPNPTPNPNPTPTTTPQVAQTQTPPVKKEEEEDEDEGNSWSYTSFLK